MSGGKTALVLAGGGLSYADRITSRIEGLNQPH